MRLGRASGSVTKDDIPRKPMAMPSSIGSVGQKEFKKSELRLITSIRICSLTAFIGFLAAPAIVLQAKGISSTLSEHDKRSSVRQPRPLTTVDRSTEATALAAQDEYQLRKGGQVLIRGQAGRIFSSMVKLEKFSSECLVRQSEQSVRDVDKYVQEGWNCVATSHLSENCSDDAIFIMRAVRVARFLSDFRIVRPSIPTVLRACTSVHPKSDLRPQLDREATVLDFALFDAGNSDPEVVKRVERDERSSDVHSGVPPYPGRRFAKLMCYRLGSGADIPYGEFWVAYCATRFLDGRDAKVNSDIDQILAERGIHD